MQAWLKCLTATGLVVLSASVASAQIQIQVQAQQVPPPAAGPVQIQVIQGGRMATAIYGGNSNRLASSDAVLVGRVVALEPMDIEAAPAKGQAKVNYRIAVIQVTEAIHGVKKADKTIRVGFVVGGNQGLQAGVVGNVFPGGGIQPAIARRPYIQPAMQLQTGQDGLFFLAKHPTEGFYLSPTYQNFVTSQNNANFDNEVKAAKQVAKVLGNPAAALKSENKDERYTAAAVLVSKYRNNTGVAAKLVPIDAAESKLILKAIAGGDWTVGRYNATVPTPTVLFSQLGITANDGYNPGPIRNVQDQVNAMRRWLNDHADKYVIKKLVADPNAKAAPVKALPAVNGAPPGVRIRGGLLPVQPPQVQPAPPPAPVVPGKK